MASLTELLGIELPLIQAPMAGVQLSALAAAICNAGALGSLPCALLAPETMRVELATLAERTRNPYNVNFFCHETPASDTRREASWRASLAPYYAELGIDAAHVPAVAVRRPFDEAALELLRAARPAVVSFHFGLPASELLAGVRALGSKVLASATTLEEALWLEGRGVDAIIAQGVEAGGHRGHFLTRDLTAQLGTFTLVPQIVRRVSVPVIAAGGIADRAGITAALALGASAVQLGTAFLLCPEATTSAVHRAALQSDASRHTALTNLFTGRPARGIVNRLMRECGPLAVDVPDFPLAASAVGPLRAAAEARGSGDFSPLWAGQNVTGCRCVPAAQLLRELTLPGGA
jgi:nitronate monooxygenase